MSESLQVKLQGTQLQESWGELINPYEFMQDTREDFGGTVLSAYSTIYDRADGRYRPVYETEMDLRRVRAMAWSLAETVPAAQSWINRLVDYTIGTGFDWSVTSKEKPQVANAVKGWIDRTFENSNWSSGLERESFAREVADGEFIGAVEQSAGCCCVSTFEPDELTLPLRSKELDEWLDLDFVSSWSFGVLTKESRPAKHYGYHLVHNAIGSDWNYIPVDKAVFWRRNGRQNAKRGFSDFHRVFLHLARSNLVLTNTAEGAATQAAIAYIVEHGQNTSRSDIERMVAADSYVGSHPDPMTGLMQRKKRMRAGTRIDTKGGKYQAGPLGDNKSNIYLDVMEALLRIAGSVHAFPEGMLTGSYANNNFASSLTAEAPFIQGRLADQASRAMRVKSLMKTIVVTGYEMGVFRSFGITLEELLGVIELSVIPSKIVHRDPLMLTQALKLQAEAGWVSDKTAMTELGRDAEVEKQNGAKALQKESGPEGENPEAPGGLEGNGPSGPSGTDPQGSQAVWMGLSRQQFIRNQKALNDIVDGLENKTIGRNKARVLLASIGMPKESIEILMQDMVDGKLDVQPPKEVQQEPVQESASRTKKPAGCRSKRVKVLREEYKAKRALRNQKHLKESFQEMFTPQTQPRGKDGKWIYSGVDTSGWPSSNSTSKACKASIKAMEKMVAQGKWDELESVPIYSGSSSPFEVGKAQAKANLLAMKSNDNTPKNAKPVGEDPAILGGWKKIGESLGTEKGGLYIGPDGKKYYVKTPDNPDRARNEVLATKLYKAVNANVIEANLVDVDGKLAVATLWADDATKMDWNSQLAKNAAAPDFAAHAWLNNWDAVGAGSENPMDNIKWIGGKATLVDAGGSLDYSGMGGAGKKPFSGDIAEHNTLVDPSINPTMAKVFGGMTPEQRQESFKKVISITDGEIADLVDKYHGGDDYDKSMMQQKLISRRDQLAEVYYAVEQTKADSDLNKFAAAQKAIDAADAELAAKDAVSKADFDAEQKASEPTAKEKKAAATAAAIASVNELKANALSKAQLAGMSLPPPPFIEAASKQANNKVLSSMYELALAKDLDGLKSMKTSGDAIDIYAQAKHKYKNQLIAGLESGSFVNPDHVVQTPVSVAVGAETPKAKVLKKSDLPMQPNFIGSNAEKNKPVVDYINAIAMGKKPDFQNVPGEILSKVPAEQQIASVIEQTKSPKLKAYAESLLAKMTGKPSASSSSVPESSKSSQVESFATGKTYARYFIHDIPPTVTSPLKSTSLTPSSQFKDKWAEGGKLYASGPKGASELLSYTGGSSSTINESLASGNPSAFAKNAVAANKYIATPMKDTVVSRTHANHFGGFKAGVEGYKKMIGHVVSEKGMLSTSVDHVVFDYNTVHWKIKAGPHAKGAHAKAFSLVSSEDEIIIPPAQKMRVLHVEEGDYKGSKKIVIHAEFLPTEDSQWEV